LNVLETLQITVHCTLFSACCVWVC